MRRSVFALYLFLAVVIVITPSPARAKDQLLVPSFQLVDPTKGESVFSWRQLKLGAATVSIWNSSDEDQEVSIQVTDFNQPGVRLFGEVIAVPPGGSPGPEKLPKREITRFVLKMDASSQPVCHCT